MVPQVIFMGGAQYHDVTIVAGATEFKAHKAIVCTQSPVLAAQMRPPWNVSV